MRLMLAVSLVGIVAGCNQLSAEPTPSQCEAWSMTVNAVDACIRRESCGYAVFKERQRMARDLSPKIEQCRNLGYLSRI